MFADIWNRKKPVFAATRRVWAGIDRTICANCCGEVEPTISKEEVEWVVRNAAATVDPDLSGAFASGQDTPVKRTCLRSKKRSAAAWGSFAVVAIGLQSWGKNNKMNDGNEPELREFFAIETPLTWTENSACWLVFFVSGPGDRRFKSPLPRPILFSKPVSYD